ncbi:hypothetical protein, partial [Spirosoma jeollabukense]
GLCGPGGVAAAGAQAKPQATEAVFSAGSPADGVGRVVGRGRPGPILIPPVDRVMGVQGNGAGIGEGWLLLDPLTCTRLLVSDPNQA